MNKNISSSLIWAGLMIAGAAGLTFAEGAGILADGGERGAGLVMGLVLAWTGNQMPKWNAGKNCATDGEAFRMRRMAGIFMMLGGLGHAVAWLVAPLEIASFVSMVPVVVALLLVLIMVIVRRRVV